MVFQPGTKGTMRTHLFICGLVLVAAAFGLLSCGNDPGAVKGTVTQDPDGAPVPQAQIVIFQLVKLEKIKNVAAYEKGAILHKALTDEKGEFSISVAPDNYVIEVWVPGRATKGRQIEVKSGRTVTVDFRVAAPSP